MRIIGEAQQQWAPLRRKYNLFLHQASESQLDVSTSLPLVPPGELPSSSSKELQTSSAASISPDPQGSYDQFAYVDEAFLSWDFSLMSSSNQLIGSVNRNFAGFGREIFTDTGVYALRMDSVGLAEEPRHLISQTGEKSTSAYSESAGGMTLDQRAVMLATAVSVDFDYFSRQRSGFGGFMPLWLGGGGEAAGAGAAGGAVGEANAGAGAVGGAARGAGVLGAEEGVSGAAAGAAGMGTMAGYEAMHKGAYGDDASPTAGGSDYGGPGQAPPEQYPGEDVWSEDDGKGGESSGSDGWGGSDGEGGGGGGDGGGGDGFDIGDWL